MERDWPAIIAALRRKADDPAVTTEERNALTTKADELAEKYKVTEPSYPLRGKIAHAVFDDFITDVFRQAEDWEYRNTTSYTSTYQTWIRPKFFYSGWSFNLDEDPPQNEYDEFPQEEGRQE